MPDGMGGFSVTAPAFVLYSGPAPGASSYLAKRFNPMLKLIIKEIIPSVKEYNG